MKDESRAPTAASMPFCHKCATDRPRLHGPRASRLALVPATTSDAEHAGLRRRARAPEQRLLGCRSKLRRTLPRPKPRIRDAPALYKRMRPAGSSAL